MGISNKDWIGHLALWVWALATVYAKWNNWSLDASALYFSSYFYNLDRWDLVYSPNPSFFWETHFPQEWVDLAKAQGGPVGNMSPYVYPPLWAAVLAPLTSRLTAIQFFNMMTILNMLATVGSVYLAYGLIRPKRVPFAVWGLICVGLLQFTVIGGLAIDLGQPQIFVTFLILLAFRALLSRKDIAAGGVLALAAAIKIAPGFLAIIFIMERRWRALWSFLFFLALLAGLGLIIAGPDLHHAFLVRLQDLSSKVLVSQVNLTVDSVLLQISNWLHGASGWHFSRYAIQAKPDWIGYVTKIVLLAGLAVSYLETRHLRPDNRIWYRLLLVYLILLITGPLAWTHYLYLVILLLPGLCGEIGPKGATLFLVTFAAVFSTAGYWVLYPLENGGNIQLFTGFAMILATIAVLVVSARNPPRMNHCGPL